MTTIAPGKLILLRDLVQQPQQYHQTSTRVAGILVQFEPVRNIAYLEYKGARLRLDTEFIDITVAEGTMVQCIGEAIFDETLNQLVLKPRIIRDVDTMDMNIYEKTVLLRQQFEKTGYPSP